jgi:hypothetical protein
MAELDSRIVPGSLMPMITRAVEGLEGDDHLGSVAGPGQDGGVEPPCPVGIRGIRRAVVIIGGEG